MPRFDYQCEKCGHLFEREHHIGEDPVVRCPQCKGKSKRLISQVGVLFKGSGFYCTDNRKSGGNGSKLKGEEIEVAKEPSAKSDTTEKKETKTSKDKKDE